METRLVSISNTHRKIARTPVCNVARKVSLSKLLIEQQGKLSELHSLARYFDSIRNVVQISSLSEHINHYCGVHEPVNICQANQQDIIDISDDSDDESIFSEPDQVCIDLDSDVEVLENP